MCHTLTSEALATLASEAIQLVDARASILAGTWQTVVSVQVTVLPHPSRLTVTAVTGNTIAQSVTINWYTSSNNLQGNAKFLLYTT